MCKLGAILVDYVRSVIDELNLPNFLDSESGWWQNFSAKFLTWLRQLSRLQKIALGVWFLGLTAGLLGWYWLKQAYKRLETDFANQLTELNQLQISVTDNESNASKKPEMASAASSKSTITIHLAGAVKKPGIYDLAPGSVLAAAIKAAGGLSPEVWQDYLDQYINLAEPMVANQKIWIPELSQRSLLEDPNQCPAPVSTDTQVNSAELSSGATSEFILVNTAAKTELMELAGIGEKRAEDIISNRPYSIFEELTSKAKIPASIVMLFKDQLQF